VRDPLEDDVEGAQLLVTTGQLRRALAGAGRVGVPDGVHDSTVSRCLPESVDFASASGRTFPQTGNRQGVSDLQVGREISLTSALWVVLVVAVNGLVFLSVLLLV